MQYQQPQYQYQQPRYNQRPVRQLKTKRSVAAYFLLSFVTLGIYPIVVMSSISDDINVIASKYDGKNTMHYCLMSFVLAPITFGIFGFVWFHQISDRIGAELRRRGISYEFGASDFWIHDVLLYFTIVCPIIFFYKMFKAMELLAQDYNVRG